MPDPFNELYNKKYDSTNMPIFNLKEDISEILVKHKNISEEHIDNLIEFLFDKGFLLSVPDKYNQDREPKIIRSFAIICNMVGELKKITQTQNFSEKAMRIIFESVNKTSPLARSFLWLNNMIERGYIIPEKYRKVLIECKYILPLTQEYATKKLSVAALSKYLTNDGKILEFLNNQQDFIELLKKNKIQANSKLYYLIINQSKLDPDCDINKIVEFFDKCNYAFTPDDCSYALTHITCNLSGFDKKDNFLDLAIRKKKVDTLTKLFDFFLKKKISLEKVINSAVFFLGNEFINYLTETNQHKFLEKDTGMTCGIIFGNLKLLTYYTDNKLIANENHILTLFHVCLKKGKLEMDILKHFIKNGSVITKNLLEVAFFVDFNAVKEYCTISSDDDIYKVRDLVSHIQGISSGLKLFGHSKKEKKISTSTEKSEDILVHICQTNSLEDILSYMSKHNMQMSLSCYYAILENPYVNVLEYFINKSYYVPSIIQIMSVSDLQNRIILLKRFHPTHANISELIASVNSTNGILEKNNILEKDDSSEDEIILPKKITKIPKKVTKTVSFS